MTVLYFLIHLKNGTYMTYPKYCSGFATCHPEPQSVILSECEGSLTWDSSSFHSSEWRGYNKILRACALRMTWVVPCGFGMPILLFLFSAIGGLVSTIPIYKNSMCMQKKAVFNKNGYQTWGGGTKDLNLSYLYFLLRLIYFETFLFSLNILCLV